MASQILAFSGSLRKDSYNQELVKHAAEQARKRGAEVTVVSLADYPMPIYNQDDEDASGIPAKAIEFRELLKSHQGFIIGCPEYNSSITAALKNAIDWATRPKQGEKPLECFAGKIVALTAASPGGLGGLRGLDHVREILHNIQCHVVPGMVSVAGAHEAFDDNGNLKNERTRNLLEGLMDTFVTTCDTLGKK
ncbi:MAG: NAD(P)H-dependent oxidoreductase [Phycisphaerales bacterium]|nr:NAD(P)H-dependent oxidoreductase [Phycisphaerales bacterium]